MRFTMIAVLALVLVFSAAPVFAFGGGGGHSAAVSAAAGGGAGGGTGVSSAATGSTGATVAATSEPLALFAVGLGLLGARYLRRR
jgi:hypothetical protein